jgi:hypothetical protein
MDYHLDSRNNLEKGIFCSVASRRRNLFAVEISCRKHEKNLRSTARRSVHEPDADLVLQRLNLLRERRLRDADALGGAGKTELFGDCEEMAQVSKFFIISRTYGLAVI